MILGGEVDCLLDQGDESRIQGGKRTVETKEFVELKTNVVIESERDESGFERYVGEIGASKFEVILIGCVFVVDISF